MDQRVGRACEGTRRLIETPGLPLTLLAFMLVIGPLVFIHEMGHYLAGRFFGVKSDAFSIGFGREIAGWTDKRGTRWKIGWMPLGGYAGGFGGSGGSAIGKYCRSNDNFVLDAGV